MDIKITDDVARAADLRGWPVDKFINWAAGYMAAKTLRKAGIEVDRPCKPHAWLTPKVGDEGLTCAVCDRRLSFIEELTPSIRSSIVNAYERLNGIGAYQNFTDALDKAHEAARHQYREASRPAIDYQNLMRRN